MALTGLKSTSDSCLEAVGGGLGGGGVGGNLFPWLFLLLEAYHIPCFVVPFISKASNLVYLCFFKFIFIGLELLYNAVLVSTVQQSESAVHIHISPLFWLSFPFRSPQSTEQSSLCYTVGSH